MKKIPSIWERNHDGDRLIRPEVVPGCEWVVAGQGYATRKYDGTACMVQNGVLYKRYDAKKGKTPPSDFLPCESTPDPVTGHWPGWVPVGDGKEDQWHREAWVWIDKPVTDGTYELVGPHIQGNPEPYSHHLLIPHGRWRLSQAPRGFDTMKAFLTHNHWEGLVYYHPDGRMAKVKRRDFGLPWPVKEAK